MSAAASRSRSRRPAPAERRLAAARRRQVRRRRLGAIAFVVVVASMVAAAVMLPRVNKAVDEIRLPLRHEDIIRQQASEKSIDPALIAGVIYAESHFRDGQVSAAGAQGLMQLTPETARYIARKSGGIAFRVEDLGTAQVNIAYGAYYLRYLMKRYGDREAFALAAYNGGEGNVDRWIAQAQAKGEALTIAAIPFAETRAYVTKVRDAQAEYRRTYRRELGL